MWAEDLAAWWQWWNPTTPTERLNPEDTCWKCNVQRPADDSIAGLCEECRTRLRSVA